MKNRKAGVSIPAGLDLNLGNFNMHRLPEFP